MLSVGFRLSRSISFLWIYGITEPSFTSTSETFSCEHDAVQMFIFYSFQVPVFCGVIWIFSNSFTCRKRNTQTDEVTEKKNITLYKMKHRV